MNKAAWAHLTKALVRKSLRRFAPIALIVMTVQVSSFCNSRLKTLLPKRQDS
jgi:hypothetical protein